jgi:cobalamin biosynthesis Mg chelatase CobN
MTRRLTVALAAACGLAFGLLTTSGALAATAFDEVLKDYQKDGQIDTCAHSEQTLRNAQRQVPNELGQYAPDFPQALSAALRERAAGKCDKSSNAGGSTTSTQSSGGTAAGGGSSTTGGKSAVTTPAPKPGAPPPVTPPAGGELASSVQYSATASTAGPPAPLIVLAILGAILLIGGLFALVARFMGWGFEGLQPTWHTWREAGWRTENILSEFGDWLRFGR